MCLKYSRNYEDAEDTLQDSFITIFKKIRQFKGTGSFEGWMKRIVIHTALQKYRSKSELKIVTEENIKEEVDDSISINPTIEVDFLLAIIQQLPDRYRLVFNLYVLDHYSHKEISNMLHISIGTSKSNLSRARQLLQTAIENHQQIQQEA